MVDDVALNKAAAIDLQRACESSIDAAMHLVRIHKLGIPQESRDAFALLEQAGKLDASLSRSHEANGRVPQRRRR